jgi:hypothetical protein
VALELIDVAVDPDAGAPGGPPGGGAEPSAATPKRVGGRHLDEHERQAVGIAGDHLEEPLGPDGGLVLDWDAQRRQALARGAQVAHPEEQADRPDAGSAEEPETSRSSPPPRKKMTPRAPPWPHPR